MFRDIYKVQKYLREVYNSKMKWLVGIDEVGRGPLAGPLCVGMCVAPYSKKEIVWKVIKNARDSKKLKREEREFWSREAELLRLSGQLFFYTALVSNTEIDEKGMSLAIKKAIRICFSEAQLNPNKSRVVLDGSLYAPDEFQNQETIIRGDDKEPIISLASIIAKVKRDNLMTKYANKFPEYGFEKHMGYGTKEHIKAIQINGPSAVHRLTFLRSIVDA